MLARSGVFAATLFVGLAAGTASARVVVVQPGPGTPLQDAIDTAAPGDTLRLAGVFTEAIVVDRPLKLRGVRSEGFSYPAVDAGCAAPVTLTIASDDVDLKNFAVRGAAVTEVDVPGRKRVKLGVSAFRTCPSTRTGFDIAGGERIRCVNCGATDYLDAGIRVSGVGEGAGVLVLQSEVVSCGVGILIEDSLPGIELRRNGVGYAEVAGIQLRNTDGARVRSNQVLGANVAQTKGIHLDAGSNGNLLVANLLRLHTADVLDQGSGNCWRATTFTSGSLPPDNCL